MNITELRKEIDKIDDKISELFIERMKLSAEIGRVKREGAFPVLVTDREREIVDRITKKNPSQAPYLAALYSEIFRLSKSVQ